MSIAFGHRWRCPGAQTLLLNAVGLDRLAWRWLGLDGVQAIDYPGHGDRPTRDWTHTELANELADSTTKPVDVVGVGVGAVVALRLAVNHPSKVRSMVLACADPLRWQPFAEVDSAGTPLDQAAVLAQWFTQDALREPHAGVAHARGCLATMCMPAWVAATRSYERSEQLTVTELAKLSIPITLVAGLEDRVNGLRGMSQLHEHIGRSRLEFVSAPAMIHLETPEILRSSIQRHFAWIHVGQRVAAPITTFGWIGPSAAGAG